jgi:[ribosomal protein S5]-alanine N-acetyltransferase
VPRLIPPVLPSGTLRDDVQPRLTTEQGLLLRPWAAQDVPALVAAYDDAAIRYWHHRTMTAGEAGAWIATTAEPEARGRGVASDAVQRVASWALDSVGFWRLEIRHSVENPASCGVAVLAGFVEEARLARQHLHEDGWHDVHVHSRLRVAAPR